MVIVSSIMIFTRIEGRKNRFYNAKVLLCLRVFDNVKLENNIFQRECKTETGQRFFCAQYRTGHRKKLSQTRHAVVVFTLLV